MLLKLGACQTPPAQSQDGGDVPPTQTPTWMLKLDDLKTVEQTIPRLAAQGVVFIGETHDRYDHHLIQLKIIRQLHARYPNLAIGVEFFQQPFQHVLDDYIAGRLELRELLMQTEYYDRWGYDFRLYAPILDYAQKHHIPIIALNLPTEITRKVGRTGLTSLSLQEQAWVPKTLNNSVPGYRKRLEAVFAQHPHHQGSGFENFYTVQLLWDEGMAERAAQFLHTHPDRPLVILAGAGHIADRLGIPVHLQ